MACVVSGFAGLSCLPPPNHHARIGDAAGRGRFAIMR